MNPAQRTSSSFAKTNVATAPSSPKLTARASTCDMELPPVRGDLAIASWYRLVEGVRRHHLPRCTVRDAHRQFDSTVSPRRIPVAGPMPAPSPGRRCEVSLYLRWSRGRVAEGGGLRERYRVEKPYRGFESLRLREQPVEGRGSRVEGILSTLDP